MKRSARIRGTGIAAALAAVFGVAAIAHAEDPSKTRGLSSQVGRPAAAVDDSIKSIDDDYDRQLLELDHRRLERLAGLAARQAPADAAATYEKLFRLAIAGNLFARPSRPPNASSRRAALRRP